MIKIQINQNRMFTDTVNRSILLISKRKMLIESVDLGINAMGIKEIKGFGGKGCAYLKVHLKWVKTKMTPSGLFN